LTNWSQVVAGGYHTAAVKTNNTLWSWGVSSSGQLGQNDRVSRSSPVQVGALTNWSQVSAGSAHTFAVKTDGTIWAWGNGTTGQLGDNAVVARSSPVQIGALTNWSQAAYGSRNDHTAAIKTDGTLWVWGFNNNGQLGQNDRVNRSSPVQIGSLTWQSVSTGRTFTASVKTDGTLWTWGNNDQGQLGLDIATTVLRSSPVQVGALTSWYQVSAGTTHTLAITRG
jgi:alpha-tubulin suppressor-like RCC1 family protein